MTFYKPTILCIPKVDNSIKNEDIFKKLVGLNIGYIYKIFDKPFSKQENYKTLFIKFSWNTKNENAMYLKNKLLEKGSLKLVYNAPWYWKIVESKKLISDT
jgi:hypothetical protein|uniref:Uncharacterized protein n=1 Tax=viral metagenome TaxID=1070528 RepID=A0A6C0IN55_9ZZZZ